MDKMERALAALSEAKQSAAASARLHGGTAFSLSVAETSRPRREAPPSCMEGAEAEHADSRFSPARVTNELVIVTSGAPPQGFSKTLEAALSRMYQQITFRSKPGVLERCTPGVTLISAPHIERARV